MNQSLPNTVKPKFRAGFSGHETFPFRYMWLKKAVDAIAQNPSIFSQDQAMVELGVGKNMVTSIRHWAFLTSLIEDTKDGIKVSEFGQKLLFDDGWDPYLEDIATLWLLHWKISSNPSKATTWYFAFNKLTQIEFTKEQLIHEIVSFTEALNLKVNPSVITRDVDCFIRTYVQSRNAKLGLLEDSLDCPLSELGLIQDIGQRGLYVFSRGQQRELPNEIFIYALLEYWKTLEQATNVLSFDDIAYGAGSPGLVFKLDEDSISYRLDTIEKITNGALTYDETSNLRQVYRHQNISSEEYLKKYYENQLIPISKRK